MCVELLQIRGGNAGGGGVGGHQILQETSCAIAP